MKKKLTVAAMAALVAIGTYIRTDNIKTNPEISGLLLANVEALAENESTSSVEVQCNGSVIIYCEATCAKCFAKYRAINGRGNSLDVRGTCKCGSNTFFTD